jgi:hypothetical protein
MQCLLDIRTYAMIGQRSQQQQQQQHRHLSTYRATLISLGDSLEEYRATLISLGEIA